MARKSDDLAYIGAFPADIAPLDVCEREQRSCRHLYLVRAALVIALLAGATVTDVGGQGWERRGFVWAPPESGRAAEADLVAMHRAGATAVRTGLVQSVELFALADSLGINFFQDLPIGYGAAGTLSDTLSHARRLLRDAFAYADRFESARTLGLSRWLDSFSPEACQFLSDLPDVVDNEAPVGTITYYVSPFPESETCQGSVDLVLLDGLGLDPAHVARQARSGTINGFAAVGEWVDGRSPSGWMNRHSDEWQARTLETVLSTLLAEPRPGAVIFLYEWKDSGRAGLIPAPLGRSYGLHDARGLARPSYQVAAGLLGQTQDVFALSAGKAITRAPVWPAASAWLVVILVVAAFVLSPNLRRMAPRYFRAHVFYREAVAEGRDALPRESALLLAAVALGAGTTVSLWSGALAETRSFALTALWVPEFVADVMIALLEQPLTQAVVAASLFALGFVVWSSILSLLSRLGKTVFPSQTLMLVIWPQWHLIVLSFMTLGVLAGSATLTPFLVAAGLWIILLFVAMIRTVVDFTAAARISPVVSVGAVLLHPMVIVGAVVLILLARYQAESAFLIRLLD
jgi:hypothetical protein